MIVEAIKKKRLRVLQSMGYCSRKLGILFIIVMPVYYSNND